MLGRILATRTFQWSPGRNGCDFGLSNLIDRLAGEPGVVRDLEARVEALEAERDQCYAAALEALRAWMDLGLGKEG